MGPAVPRRAGEVATLRRTPAGLELWLAMLVCLLGGCLRTGYGSTSLEGGSGGDQPGRDADRPLDRRPLDERASLLEIGTGDRSGRDGPLDRSLDHAPGVELGIPVDLSPIPTDSSGLKRVASDTRFAPADVATVTSNAVTPPGSSLVVIAASYVLKNSSTPGVPPNLSITSSWPALTWTSPVHGYHPDKWGTGVAIYSAQVGPTPPPGPLTVTVTADHVTEGWSLHVSIFTGHDPVNPIGSSGSSSKVLASRNGSQAWSWSLQAAPSPSSMVLAMISTNDDGVPTCYVDPDAGWVELWEACAYPNAQVQVRSGVASQQVSYARTGSSTLNYFNTSAAVEIRSQ